MAEASEKPASDEALASATRLITEGYEILQKEASRVRQEKEAFETMAKKLEHVHFSKPIKLNVGGQYFTTSIDTLRKDAGSMLNAMFSGRFDTKPSEDGSFFIDRDGTHFLYILNYLRTGKLSAPEDARTRGELLTEAEFYQLRGVIEELKPKPVVHFSESTILSEEQRRILKSWMEETRFTLLFRASRDGWAAADFHSRCDNKGPTVTIVKSGTYIFGGYADTSWHSKCLIPPSTVKPLRFNELDALIRTHVSVAASRSTRLIHSQYKYGNF